MPATFCNNFCIQFWLISTYLFLGPSDCGVSHILAPTYNHAPVRGGEQSEADTVADNRVEPQEIEPAQQATEYKKHKFNLH